MVRLIIVCALVIAVWPPVAAAQEASSSLEALFRARELRRGVGIYVTDETGQRMKGKVIDLSRHVADGRNPGRRYEHRDFRDPSNRASGLDRERHHDRARPGRCRNLSLLRDRVRSQ